MLLRLGAAVITLLCYVIDNITHCYYSENIEMSGDKVNEIN